jgi:hypothetical protein
MGRPQRSDLDFEGIARALNLPDAVDPQEPATLAQVRALLEGLAWKDNCRVSTQGNIDLASPGATVDGVTMEAGDRVLVRAQTDASENGIYIWNGAAVPMTRADDAASADELESATVTVDEGTDAGTTWRQESVNFDLDTDDVGWASFGTGVPDAAEGTKGKIAIATQTTANTGTDDTEALTSLKAKSASWMLRRYAATIGDNSATSFTVTHNLATRDLVVLVRETGGNYREVDCEVRVNDDNSIDLLFAAAPATNGLRVVIHA